MATCRTLCASQRGDSPCPPGAAAAAARHKHAAACVHPGSFRHGGHRAGAARVCPWAPGRQLTRGAGHGGQGRALLQGGAAHPAAQRRRLATLLGCDGGAGASPWLLPLLAAWGTRLRRSMPAGGADCEPGAGDRAASVRACGGVGNASKVPLLSPRCPRSCWARTWTPSSCACRAGPTTISTAASSRSWCGRRWLPWGRTTPAAGPSWRRWQW